MSPYINSPKVFKTALAFYLGFAGNITPRGGEQHIARELQVA